MSEKKPTKSRRSAKPPTPAATGPMDVALLQQLVSLMAANDLNTIEVRDGEKRIVLNRGAVAAAVPTAPAVAVPAPAPTATPAAKAAPTAPADEDAGLLAIKSPMVGSDIHSNRYQTALRRKDIMLDRLDTSHLMVAGQIHLQKDTSPTMSQKMQEQINDVTNGQLPAAWSEALKEYYKKLSEQK